MNTISAHGTTSGGNAAAIGFSETGRILNHYFFLSYLAVLVLLSGYLHNIALNSLPATLFIIVVYLTYGFIYLLPALLISKTLLQIFKSGQETSFSKWKILVISGTAVFTIGMILTILFADHKLFSMYGFHINGFVWNIITTPGGIESMGGDAATTLSFIGIALAFFAFQVFLFLTSYMVFKKRIIKRWPYPAKTYRYLIAIFFLLSVSERLTYGISKIEAYSPVLSSAGTVFLYQPLSVTRLAKKLGFEVKLESDFNFSLEGNRLNYPKEPLVFKKPEKLLNIVWLVAESWRWDMLDPEIMPATWKFAGNSYKFTRHYSSGNGTRMGLFGMFYGLYGNYWFQFLNERKSPALMDQVQKQGYQMGLYTSAKFSYPEFDKTIFSGIPAQYLHEFPEGPGWERDRKNVTDMLEFLKNRDQKRPFMTFMFFESPHARYYFPPENIIRPDYLKELNYATMDLSGDIALIKNRYINSCNHLDSQFKRILDYLEKENLLSNTIVIITGDHGEEFMEKGRWGHNSHFSEEQIRVPMVLRLPNTKGGQVDRMTSHLDIPATILPFLGVENPPEDYSLGFSLVGGRERKYLVADNWTHFCYVGDNYKATIGYESSDFSGNEITDGNDRPLGSQSSTISTRNDDFVKIMNEMGFFMHKG